MHYRVFNYEDTVSIKDIINDCSQYLAFYGKYTYWMLANIYEGYSYVAEDNDGVCGFITALPVPDKNAVFVSNSRKFRSILIIAKITRNIIEIITSKTLLTAKSLVISPGLLRAKLS